MKHKIIIGLFFFLQTHFFAQEADLLQQRIDSIFVSDYFRSSQATISIYDLTANKQLYQRNEKLLMRPASTLKIFTTAAAYLFLGSNYNFRTSVYHTGEVEDSICLGDLYVTGGFDPDFSLNDLDSLVSEIKNYGIKQIRGNLYADVSVMDSLYWGEGWMWDDNPSPFAVYLSPLNINDNSISITCEPSNVGSPAKIKLTPYTNYFQIINRSVTTESGKSTLTITRDWINRSNSIIVKGNFPKADQPITTTLNVFNPTFYFLNLMKESFERNGISFKGIVDTLTLKSDAESIFSLERNIEPVIMNTNKTSDNLSAEMLLRTLALNFADKPATAKKGIALVDSLITLIGLNPHNYTIADGSGLSFYNLLSAELLTEALKYFYFSQPEIFIKLFNSFPISGFDGTLSDRMKKSSGYKRVHAKTGSLRGVSTLSGYIRSKNSHIIAFSILIQNYVRSASEARSIQDKICEIIFETN